MKKIFAATLLATSVLFTNCTSLNTTGSTTQNNIPLNTVQSILNNGTQEAFSIFGDSNEFLTNALIEAAMPQQLKDINSKLTSLGLSSVVKKEQALISNIANTSIATAKPILSKAINEMTTQDAIAIISGGKNGATTYLKDKTYNDLINAITPVVSTQTEKLGINSLLTNALGNNSSLNGILGAVLGTGSTASGGEQLNNAISKQLVDGLFNVVENSESNVRNNPSNLLNSILNK